MSAVARAGRSSILVAALAGLALAGAAESALAAPSRGCAGSGFALVLPDGGRIAGEQRGTVPAAALGDGFRVDGTYVEFAVRAASFGIEDYTLTGAPNPLDMTGGRRTPVFAAKTPDLQGARLTGDMSVRLRDDSVELMRAGAGVSMKIQAKDCAQGGIFQMEPERADGGPTTITHVLADGVFYFDNPFFRERIGQVLNGVTVSARVNFANDVSRNFVGRDSPQVAEKLSQTGRTSVWSVASGGRMGGVLGEDAVEVAPPSTDCVEDCQAQNQVRGRFVVLGFPFPVPAASRLTDDGTPAGGTAAAAALGAPDAPMRALRAPALGTPRIGRRAVTVAVTVPARARVVRVALHRRGGRRPLTTTRKAVRPGRRRVVVRLRVRLRPGRYVLRAHAGSGASAARFAVAR